ncbi:type I methionyl aminopeptidase [Fictibacillus norfolkensis]|uniref:Methionine aminopeptidase n=1 Tax=Fictibacillus norfolkensis TaxID=2762233 RepID=A0ABR8SQM7_9BACL|nr:type I methionyl aminopeptidase [Fictibacillus norfolkensis]MBD7965700.1 type I methionyl aminopeptidase [Fictibacillus norfolkensis]
MIKIKSQKQIEKMHEAGRLLASCHRELSKLVIPGTTTYKIDQFVENYLTAHGAKAAQKGYMGYPFATCASVNDEVCHGLPNKNALRDGDIVTIDFVVNLNGWLADSAWSYEVGRVSKKSRALLETTKHALYKGIEQARVGNRIGDIGHAIQSYAENKGYSIVREFIGHGIGRSIHEEPQVHHVGERNTGITLKEGMVLTIEPILNQGRPHVSLKQDGWTAVIYDGSLSAQYEHTVAITKEGPIILTEQA